MNEKEGTTHVVKVLIPHLEPVLHFLFPPPSLLLILSILPQSIVCKYTMYLVAVAVVVLAVVVCNCRFR